MFSFLFFSQVKPAISEQAYCALVIPIYAQSASAHSTFLQLVPALQFKIYVQTYALT